MIGPKSTLTEVAFAVCTALGRASLTAVLTGESAATFYAPDAYQSRDLDFIITLSAPGGPAVLEALGFTEQGQVYRHPSTHFTLDFPRGPLAVGDDLITTWRTVRRRRDVLHVLTPTDSCRDRLESFLFWNDFSGLEQALAVVGAQRRQVDLEKVEQWCRREGTPRSTNSSALASRTDGRAVVVCTLLASGDSIEVRSARSSLVQAPLLLPAFSPRSTK